MSTTTPSTGTREVTDLPGRFKWLVQSPLRSGLIRYLHSRTSDAFSVEGFMQRFGKLQQDVENCLRELVAPGERPVLRRAMRRPVQAIRPQHDCSLASSPNRVSSATKIVHRPCSASAR